MSRLMLRALLTAILLASAGGCAGSAPIGGSEGGGNGGATAGTGGSDIDPDGGAPTFTWLYDNMFHVYCSDRGQPCHNPGINRGVSMSTRDRAFASLQFYVVPGDAFASDVYYFVSAGVMPPTNPHPPAELQAALAAWIDAGAMDD